MGVLDGPAAPRSGLLAAFTPEAGQRRREWLGGVDDSINAALDYYLGPQLAPRVKAAAGLLGMVSPGQDVIDAYGASGDLVAPGRSVPERAAAGATLAGALGAMLMPGGVSSLRQGIDDVVDAGVRAYDPSRVNIFAGVNAKTADTGALARAQDMAQAGASRDEIWRDTGWFQGVDGQWRFEIDDSAFGLRDNAVRPVERYSLFGRADRTIDHNNLTEAYDLPFEYDLGVGSNRGGSMRGATYWRTDIPDRGISSGDVQDMGRIRVRGADRPELERTTLHEIQHAVQDTEGFARGSNLSDEAANLAARRDRELMQQVESALTPQESADLARYRQLSAEYRDAATVPGDVVIEVNDLRQRLRRVEGLMDELRILRSQGQGGALEGGAINREAAWGQYRRVSGEVESRNVEARRDFTPEQRRATPPWETQDVPDADQIVRR